MEKMYKNKNVVVTGHTGFKGSWLVAWLKQMGALVTGIALDPPSIPSHYDASKLGEGIQDHRIDIRNEGVIEQAIVEAKPDFLFHLELLLKLFLLQVLLSSLLRKLIKYFLFQLLRQ